MMGDMEALAFFIELGLTQRSYQALRNKMKACNAVCIPSYRKVLQAKSTCIRDGSLMIDGENGVISMAMQDVLDWQLLGMAENERIVKKISVIAKYLVKHNQFHQIWPDLVEFVQKLSTLSANLRKGNIEETMAGKPHVRDFPYKEEYEGVHRKNQIDVAIQLFEAMGIERDDKERQRNNIRKKAKAILNLNPAFPCINMQTTIFAKTDFLDIKALNKELNPIVAEIQRYVPGYDIISKPIHENGRASIMIKVK